MATPIEYEDAHVEAALGDQHPRGVDVDAGDRAEQLDELGVGLGGGRAAGVERGDRLVERVDVGEQTGDEHAVVGELEAVGERLLQLRDLRPQPGFGERGQLGRVADPGEQRFEHRACRGRVGRRGDA
jgi:hypothetical protein